jgi:hypothetical protein
LPLLVWGGDLVVTTHTSAVRIDPGHHGAPCRATIRVYMELCQHRALGSQSVDVGRRNLRPEDADVGISQVVGYDE